jgi:eukaryotic-like serine/threonine-protein kinase
VSDGRIDLENESSLDAGLPRVGDTIDERYVLERVIGTGGMGVVVAARHLTLDERVAIKFLRPKHSDAPDAVRRFLREARACAKIKNEHVVRVMDCNTLPSGVPYILMEFLEGTDLAHVRHPLAIAQAVDYVLQACEGIADAHASGFVHRDLKPSNLFLTRRSDGTACVKVLDFGISKAMAEGPESSSTMTDTQSVFGSPGYMSPEQVRSAKRVDHRSDIWSLGVILYELLTGKMPFLGEGSNGTLASVIADTPVPAIELRPEIPAALGRVVSQCLEKDVALRIQTLADLARALEPHGGAEALASLERIERLGMPRSAASGPISSPSTQRGPRSHATPVQITATQPSPTPRGDPRVRLGLLAGAFAVAVLALAWRAGSASAPPDAATSSATAPRPEAPSPSVATASPVVLTLPDPGMSATATPMPSASVSAGAARPSSRPSAAVTARPSAPPPARPSATAGAPGTTNPPTFDLDRR